MYSFSILILLFFCVFLQVLNTLLIFAPVIEIKKWTDLRRNTITAIIPCVKIKEYTRFREMEISLCCILYLFQICFSFFSLSAELLTLYITSIGMRVKSCTMPLGRDFARAPALPISSDSLARWKPATISSIFYYEVFFRITQSYK